VKTAQVTSPTEDITAPEDVDPVKVPSDLFGVVFKCRDTEVPWRSLLAHAVAIRQPLLAIIAACEKVRIRGFKSVGGVLSCERMS